MDQSSLVTEQVDAGARFLREFERFTPVTTAFWLKDSEDGHWNLYVASDRFDAGNPNMAYEEVLRISRQMNVGFEPFQVKLVALSEPAAQAALQAYKRHPPKIPLLIRGGNFGGIDIEEVYLVKGPTGEHTMPSGREVLHEIIDQEANFFQQHGRPPSRIRLPVLMAYDLAKCGRDELGELSGRVFKDGITVFEKEGFHGMSVEIVRDRNAALELE